MNCKNCKIICLLLLLFLFGSSLSCKSSETPDNPVKNGVIGPAGTIKTDDHEIFETESEKQTEKNETTAENEKEKESEPDLPVYEINPKFDDLLKINGDVVGEIKIDGTIIDFPVLYSGDNEYYLRRDIYKNDTKYGSIFMEMLNRGAILDRNTIIHGHNFEGRDNNMFAELEKFKNEEFFENNKKVVFNNLYSDMEWEVFSVYVVGEKDYYLITRFGSEKEYISFANLIKSKSMFGSDYEPKEGDYMLTLHTCSYEFDGAHTLVHARLIKKTDNYK